MPRGNDSQAALVDLQGQYSGGGNAEEMIRSQKLSITPELRAALLSPRDEEATKELLANDGLDKASKKVDDGEVIALAVRGRYVLAVVEVESGRVYKEVFAAEDFGINPERSARKAASHPSDLDDDQREEIKERLRTLAKAEEAAREAEKKANEARAEALKQAEEARKRANDPKAEAKAEAAKAKADKS